MRKPRGFTLIELLVVISIIAVLLAILIPSLGKAREKVKDTSCRANLKNVGLALQMYLDAYDRKMPNTAQLPTGSSGTIRPVIGYRPQTVTGNTYWGIYFYDYLKDTEGLRMSEPARTSRRD